VGSIFALLGTLIVKISSATLATLNSQKTSNNVVAYKMISYVVSICPVRF